MRGGLVAAGCVPAGLTLCAVAAVLTLPAHARAAAASNTDPAPFSLSAVDLYARASRSQAPAGADVQVLEAQESYRFDAEGNSRFVQYTLYKVLSPAGVSRWNALAMAWSPWRNEQPVLKARVISADGTEYALDPATITDSPAHDGDAELYGDNRVVRAPLPAIAPGAVVETEVVRLERPPFPASGAVSRSWFRMEDPVQHFRLTLEAPRSVALRYRVDLLPQVSPIHSTEGELERWVFDAGPAVPIEDVPNGLPADVHSIPVVTFSTGKSWHDVALGYQAILSARLASADVRELAARLTRGLSSKEAKAEALVEYLNQEIRYTGVEFDAASVVPHSVAETLSRKYGDCKDKSLLLVALLRAAGVAADMALLDAGDRLDVSPDLPGMGLFDHAIVYVPGDPAIWIDSTDENARLGQLADTDRGRYALIINPQTTRLTRVSEARSVDNVLVEEREIRLAEQGAAHVVEISRPRGIFEADYRADYADLERRKTRENLTAYFKSQYLAERVERMDRSDPRDFSKPFELTLEGSGAGRGDTTLSEAVAYIRVRSLFSDLPDELRTPEPAADTNASAAHPLRHRTEDYQLKRPYVSEWHYRIVPPAGFIPSPLPQEVHLALGPASFTESFAAEDDGVVHADLRFDTVQRRFTPAEQSALRNAVAKLISGETIKIKFDLRAHRLLVQGHPRESFEAYRQLIREQPDKAIQHLRRADGLLAAGMGEAARAEAREAATLEPHSAFALRTLARILQYDLLGRWHETGADLAGAAAAYRAAIALVPSDTSLIASYALLLEYDPDGVRYGAGSDLQEAIAQYSKLSSRDLIELNVQYNPAYALFHAGDCTRALASANSVGEPPLALSVACTARQRGAEYALDEARRATDNDQKFNEAALTAGQLLLNVREYPLAATLLEAGASGPETARTIALAAVLKKTRKHEELRFADTPQDLVRQVLLAVLRTPGSAEALKPFVSRNALLVLRDTLPEERESQDQALGLYLRAMRHSGLTSDVMTDIALATLQLKSSGDDAVGYRETLQIPNMPNEAYYIVKEQGRCRILDTGAAPVALALEALERLRQGNLTGARVLLGWVRELRMHDNAVDPDGDDSLKRLWSTDAREQNAEEITLAAATLLVQRRATAARGVALLEQFVNARYAVPPTEDIDRALLSGYEHLSQHDKALTVASRMLTRSPHSTYAFLATTAQMRALHRFAEADELAQRRLNEMPNDLEALRVLAENLAARHDYAHAYEEELKIVANAASGVGDLNELAWQSLFFHRTGGPDLDTAMRGAQLAGNDHTLLHTLACLYAEVGKAREAREVLLQAMDAQKLTEPSSEYWYTLGRIAEQYGEREIAAADYARVQAPADGALEFNSSYRLAQTRMQALGTQGL